MVVDTRKSVRERLYKPKTVGAEYLKAGFHGHYKTASYLPIKTKAMADFIIADTTKGSFIIIEIKINVRQESARQISAYLRMPAAARGLYILPVRREMEQGRIIVHEDLETLPELIQVARTIDVTYLNKELVENLLGIQGKRLLEKMINVIRTSMTELDWPLAGVEIRHVRDVEVEDWEYILLLLVFNCDFNTADKNLHELYNRIDTLTRELHNEEREILQRMIFFDIETRVII